MIEEMISLFYNIVTIKVTVKQSNHYKAHKCKENEYERKNKKS